VKHPTLRRRGTPGSRKAAAGDARSGSGSGAPPGSSGGGKPPTPPSPKVDDASPDGLQFLFEAAKNEVDAQAKITERIDGKARALFALAGVIFAAAQALALRQDVLADLSASAKDDVVDLALVAGGLLAVALLLTAATIFVRREQAVQPAELLRWLNQLQSDQASNDRIAKETVKMYIDLAHDRQRINNGRVSWLHAVQLACVLSIAASTAELLFALSGLT